MKYFIVKNIVLVLTLSLVACASIFSEKSQSISVNTGDVEDATCELFNNDSDVPRRPSCTPPS